MKTMNELEAIEEEYNMRFSHQYGWTDNIREAQMSKIENFCRESRMSLQKKKNYVLLENVDQLCFTTARVLISLFQISFFKNHY